MLQLLRLINDKHEQLFLLDIIVEATPMGGGGGKYDLGKDSKRTDVGPGVVVPPLGRESLWREKMCRGQHSCLGWLFALSLVRWRGGGMGRAYWQTRPGVQVIPLGPRRLRHWYVLPKGITGRRAGSPFTETSITLVMLAREIKRHLLISFD